MSGVRYVQFDQVDDTNSFGYRITVERDQDPNNPQECFEVGNDIHSVRQTTCYAQVCYYIKRIICIIYIYQ